MQLFKEKPLTPVKDSIFSVKKRMEEWDFSKAECLNFSENVLSKFPSEFWNGLGYSHLNANYRMNSWEGLHFKKELERISGQFEKHFVSSCSPKELVVNFKHADGYAIPFVISGQKIIRLNTKELVGIRIGLYEYQKSFFNYWILLFKKGLRSGYLKTQSFVISRIKTREETYRPSFSRVVVISLIWSVIVVLAHQA